MVFSTLLNMLYVSWGNSILGYETALGPEVNWKLVSVVGKVSHCDGAFVRYSTQKRMSADHENACGAACRDIVSMMGSLTSVKYGISHRDRTQYLLFQTNQSILLGKVPSGKGSVDVSTSNILAFRGTTALDVINMRRNFIMKFVATTLCAQCEIHQGFWYNYLALRPAFQSDLAVKGLEVVTMGNSMGAPLATMAAYQAVLLDKTVKAVLTTGMPRVANAPFAKKIYETLTDGMGTVGFAYARDPVPHCPPRFFGYVSTQAKLFHIKILVELDAVDPDLQELNTVRHEDTDFGEFVYVSKVYVNSISSFDGDKKFADSVSSYAVSDHNGYWSQHGGPGCAIDSADTYLQVKSAASLFYI